MCGSLQDKGRHSWGAVFLLWVGGSLSFWGSCQETQESSVFWVWGEICPPWPEGSRLCSVFLPWGCWASGGRMCVGGHELHDLIWPSLSLFSTSSCKIFLGGIAILVPQKLARSFVSNPFELEEAVWSRWEPCPTSVFSFCFCVTSEVCLNSSSR